MRALAPWACPVPRNSLYEGKAIRQTLPSPCPITTHPALYLDEPLIPGAPHLASEMWVSTKPRAKCPIRRRTLRTGGVRVPPRSPHHANHQPVISTGAERPLYCLPLPLLCSVLSPSLQCLDRFLDQEPRQTPLKTVTLEANTYAHPLHEGVLSWPFQSATSVRPASPPTLN
jgi:hypothetical protein